MLKRTISIILLSFSLLIMLYDYNDINEYKEKIDDIIIKNNISNKYDGYINIPSLNYKGLIKKGDYNKVLDDNLVLMVSSINTFDDKYGNIILAGHNNKYVFSKIFKLKISDEIIVSNFKNKYKFIVNNIDYINIKDKQILDNVYNKKILTLITCTNNNQIRYVVRCIEK